MDKKDIKKLAHGTSITFIGGVLGAGFTYLTGVGISRLVGSELVGVYYLSLVWMQLLSAISRFGFADALLRFIPPERKQGLKADCQRIIKTTVCLGLLFGVILGGGLYFLIPFLGDQLGLEPVLVSYLRWFFLFMPLHVLFTLLLMVVQSYQRMAQVVLVRDILQPVSLFLLTLLLLVFVEDERIGLIGGFVASLALSVAMILRWVHVVAPGFMAVRGWMALGTLFTFAMPAMGADASHFLYRWADTLLVSHFFGLREVGIYSAAIRTSMLLALIPMAVNAIYATMSSGYYHTGSPEKLERALQLSTRWCLILGLPIVVLFVLAAQEVMALWGDEYTEEYRTLAVLAVAQLFNIPAGILAYTLVMCNRPGLELINTLTLLVLVVATNLVLIPMLGLVGAAVSLLLVNAFGMSLRWYQVQGRIRVRPFNWNILKPFASIALAGVAGAVMAYWMRTTFGSEPYSVLYILLFAGALAAVIGIVYLVSLYMLGYEDEDRVFAEMIFSNLQKVRGNGNAA